MLNDGIEFDRLAQSPASIPMTPLMVYAAAAGVEGWHFMHVHVKIKSCGPPSNSSLNTVLLCSP